jgi:DNA-binding NarL/FixJ family response regulator
MIRILVADDHTIMRQGLVQLLADIEDCQVAGQAASGFEVLEKIRAESFDVVLLDLTMPGRHGVDLIRQIKLERPALKILVLSMHREEQYALRALQAGASGYLTKESAADELIAAIRKVVDGESYISALIARSLAMSLVRPETRPPHSDLSNREFQVLMMIAEGRALTEIAAELSLSAKTISTYKTRVLEKLKLDDTAALIRYALEHGLIEDRRVPPAPQ